MLRPLIDVRIQFLFNILRTNTLIESKFCTVSLSSDSAMAGLLSDPHDDDNSSYIKPQELEVRSLNHPYNLKTKS